MSRATNRTSNISVTWNFKNPNISRNELINFIHLFREVPGHSREVPGYSRGLSRHYLAISAASLYLYCLAVFIRRLSIFIFHLSSFIFHRTRARKSPERLSSPSQHPPRSFLTTPPEISRFLLPLYISTASRSSSGAISPFSSFISHRTPARKFPERLFSPSQRPPESFPTLPPEISRFPFGTKVIKILDLSPYLPPTRPFTVSPTLSYSPTPVHHQPRHPPESAPLIHQSPCTFYPHLTLSYNNTHQSSSSLPTITKFAFPTGPSALLSFLFPKTSPSPTTPPDRIRSSRSSISLHVLSSSHPALRQHSSVQFITSYNHQVRFPDSSPCIVILPIPQNQSFTNHATRQNPLFSFINLLARSILISPCLTTTLISPVHHFLQLPSSLSRQFPPHCYPSDWEFRTRRAGNCTELHGI